ncbi:hypothetical protein DZC73_25645 [Albitalea terrae]|uniref:Uncharacterized protein n=2 Tax=Piscinibacter terrae TaxID=2496871 RepID=A0A3N7HLC0_9BURK|nr:hypothetical protein DZC73_25645 [Albitalea terrae]
MLDLSLVSALYHTAREITHKTPQIGGTLAGNCTTVHFGMLDTARQIFGAPVQLSIGSITLDGTTYYDFTEEELLSWRSGHTRPRYGLHAWLSLPHLGNEVIDLTLAATLNHAKPGWVPAAITFITARIATRLNLEYHARLVGDGVLEELNLVRGRQA